MSDTAARVRAWVIRHTGPLRTLLQQIRSPHYALVCTQCGCERVMDAERKRVLWCVVCRDMTVFLAGEGHG